ncbi:ATP-dependent DNA ligase [Georgenia sp. SYP-B2076]|uniref:ATP-dependent DNA ligase n=1 Tax=Georgenia sp. SYP-B2076 TaxID=2495881 RepID=UPI000F8D841D|nr:ATP-dependent DNA ligase [Georgenia sp. SYP-B2076]
MPAREQSETVTIEGRRLRLTNLSKVLYPETGTTKADVLGYLAEIAPVMLPHCAGRPATRKRWPAGVGTAEEPGEVFFIKNLEQGAPDWVVRADIEHSTGPKAYPIVDGAATLAWLGQMGALEIHVPQWRFGSDGEPRNPDRLVLDLDPGSGVGLPECAEVARIARALLEGMGLEPVPVTSGSKGIHLYAALDGSHTSDQINAIAHELARAMEADHKDLVVSDMKRALRGGKVLVDWSQNNSSKTTIAPYSLRGRPHPTVAAPRTWRELDSPDLAQLEYPEVLRRVRRGGDPMAVLLGAYDAPYDDPGERTPAAREALRGDGPGGGGPGDGGPGGGGPGDGGPGDGGPGDGGPGGGEARDAPGPAPSTRVGLRRRRDRLATYRAMRDPARTPEPVPEAILSDFSEAAQTFVIQEHHARRLHWDFRLAHEGVLVSWALPKGVPVDRARNNLAVQTEDHPMEYGTFEGTIPRGEYGGGEVTIWDSGTYELHKWREGKEVIVTLTGREDGGLATDGPGRTAKLALIRTGGRGGEDGNHWLIHLMDPEAPSRWRRPHATGAHAVAARRGGDDGGRAGRGTVGRGGAEHDAAGQRAGRGGAEHDAAGQRAGRGGADHGTARSGADLRPETRGAVRRRTGDARTATARGGRSARLPTPMLATLGTVADLSDHHDWALEMKWDGVRAVVEIEGGQVRLVSRNGNEVTRLYPELAGIAPVLTGAGRAVLDGEIVALDGRGRPSFARLQKRFNLTDDRQVEALAADNPVRLLLFDALEADGEPLTDRTYDARREALRGLVDPGAHPLVDIPDVFEGDVASAVRASRTWGLEGVMAKRRDSRYTPGRRSPSWVKIKHSLTQEVVVIGWRPGQGNRAGAVGSLLIAVPDGAPGDAERTLRYAGRVGTGFTLREAEEWLHELVRTERATPPAPDVPRPDARDARWVTPGRVAEVELSEWTGEGRMRHPRWRGWRPDKSVDDVVLEVAPE